MADDIGVDPASTAGRIRVARKADEVLGSKP
jgi:hypothetical protein